MIIRPATVEDAPGIGLVHVRSWQVTYRGQMPDAVLDGLQPEQRAAGWGRYLGRGVQDREALLVADDDRTVVGFVSVGPSRDDDVPDFGELRAIYVHPDQLGRGYGRDLMRAGLDAMRGAHFSDAVLWVLEGNTTAQHFYERGGWMPDGSSKRDEGMGFPIDEIRYRIDLAAG